MRGDTGSERSAGSWLPAVRLGVPSAMPGGKGSRGLTGLRTALAMRTAWAGGSDGAGEELMSAGGTDLCAIRHSRRPASTKGRPPSFFWPSLLPGLRCELERSCVLFLGAVGKQPMEKLASDTQSAHAQLERKHVMIVCT